MQSMKTHDKQGSPEAGFALILALLILTLLTTMGLALSTTTTTEMQISLNHRWTQSARYNAEAGIEYGKSLLTATPSWAAILPPPRTNPDWLPTAWNGGSQSATTGTPRFDRATRNFESWQCDKRGYGMGYGVVLDDGGQNFGEASFWWFGPGVDPEFAHADNHAIVFHPQYDGVGNKTMFVGS
ncbi:MAG: PilX N-terminal domain-containing pilus assembly protein, partial [Vicinamibacteria bacterium]